MTDSSQSNLFTTLRELRRRILVVLCAIGFSSAIAYLYSEKIARIFMAPLFAVRPDLSSLVYTNLTEAFLTYIKVSLIIGVIGSFPVLIHEVWMFVSPGLYRHEKKVALTVMFWATVLFGAGVSFSYFIVLPQALSFFLGFAGEGLEPRLRLGAYLTFVARSSLAFGLAFEIPFLMMAANKSGLVARKYFKKKRLSFYGVIAVCGFMLVAGDIMAAFLLTLPLILLYESGVFLTGIFRKSD